MERYEVFISFRGEDTRRGFTDFLYHCLVDYGINAFMDSKKLRAGEDISAALINAIRGSRVSVVVFSEGYADSRWCLDELVEIMECHKTGGQIVMPVFIDVPSTDVRNQTGSFKDAFDQHQSKYHRNKVEQWKSALNEASTKVGWDSQHPYYNQQGLLVKEIVRRISVVLSDEWHMYVAAFPVGLDTRVLNLRKSLQLTDGHNSVQYIWILGMGGIGKTTVAKMLYNQLLHQFEGVSFLNDVRTHAQQASGLVALREQLLDDICKTADTIPKMRHADQGINMIKSRLKNRKVLIFLDDVSNEEQVRVLAGGRDWFGRGSRVVLTTRNEDLLKVSKLVDKTYKPKPLNSADSLKLFSSHAFDNNSPDQEFIQKSEEVVRYCKGLPLALVVLGKSLKGKSEVAWNGILEKLKKIPPKSIQEKLRISYDELGDEDKLQDLFLDIACFFVGYDKDYAIAILEACGLFAGTGIDTLVNRGLVEVDEKNHLKLHDLIRDMGREIVRTSSEDPGRRSRLWCCTDVKSTLQSDLGRHQVEGIAVDSLEVLKVNAEAFRKMKRLRLLNLNNLDVEGTYGYMSKQLRWLRWHNFSRNSFPDDLHMEEVVAIDMQYNSLKMFYNHQEVLRNLRFLNLSHSKCLTKIPNFLKFPHLEELILEDCVELTYIHKSIGELGKLVLANLKGCKKLKKIPDSMSKLESLKFFNISGCSKIEILPKNLEQMESLMELIADGSAITYIPPSIEHLKILTHLSLCGCKISTSDSFSSFSWSSWLSTSVNKTFSQFIWSWLLTSRIFQSSYLQVLSLCGLSCLRVLKLMDCGLSNNTTLLNAIFTLLSLEELDLRKNNFSSLPHNIIHLAKLKVLLLDDCKYLEFLPDMPASLFMLTATNCTSLKRVSVTRFEPGTQLLLSNCPQLTEIFGLDCQEPGGNIHLEQCNNLTSDFKDFLLKNWCGRGHVNVFLPGSEVPVWIDCKNEGCAVDCEISSVDVQGSSRRKGFTVCVIFAPNEVNTESGQKKKEVNTETQPFPRVKIEAFNVQYHSLVSYKSISTAIKPVDHMWVFHLPGSVVEDFQSVKKLKLSAQFGVGWTVKWVGVYFYFGS